MTLSQHAFLLVHTYMVGSFHAPVTTCACAGGQITITRRTKRLLLPRLVREYRLIIWRERSIHDAHVRAHKSPPTFIVMPPKTKSVSIDIDSFASRKQTGIIFITNRARGVPSLPEQYYMRVACVTGRQRVPATIVNYSYTRNENRKVHTFRENIEPRGGGSDRNLLPT